MTTARGRNHGGNAPMSLNRFAKFGLMFAALAAVAATAPAAQADEYNKSYTVTGRAQVHVDTNDGAVRVMTVPGSKSVEFHVEYQGLTLDRNLRIESHQNGDSVELVARMTGHWGFSLGWNNRRLRIEVHMPREADLDIQTGDGSVETEALNGGLHVHTGDGSVRSDSVSGSVDIYTGDGSITLAGRFDQLTIKTGDGSINALASPGSKMGASWTIHTGDGSVDLSLPGDLQADIDASTHDGHISLGIPVTVEGTFSNSQIHGKMNGGGQVLSVHTGDGAIRLKKS